MSFGSKKKIVVIGGGNGTGAVISGLKNSFHLSALVSMADDGGSTGRLRKEQGVSAAGDIRQCLTAFTESEHSKKLFSYRFKTGKLEGHSFGNLFISTIEKSTGNLYKAIDQAKNILDIKEGEIIPITDYKPHLQAVCGDRTIKGVFKIANTKIDAKKTEFKLTPPGTKISKMAKDSILKADLIIIAPGNFYCSVIPALIAGDVVESLATTKAKKVFIANLVNFPNHTKGFTVADYLSELSRITKNDLVDIVIANDHDIDASEDSVRLGDKLSSTIEIIKDGLVSPTQNKIDPNDKIAQVRSKFRHDGERLNNIITRILRS